MKSIKLKAPWEDFEIEVGDRTVRARMATDPASVARVAGTAQEGQEAARQAEKANAKAAEARDAAGVAEAAATLARALGAVVKEALGAQAYGEILDACGATPENPSPATQALKAVFLAVLETISGHSPKAKAGKPIPKEKAAHYLGVVPDVHKPEPDEGASTD